MDFKEKFNTVMKYFQVITLIKKFKENNLKKLFNAKENKYIKNNPKIIELQNTFLKMKHLLTNSFIKILSDEHRIIFNNDFLNIDKDRKWYLKFFSKSTYYRKLEGLLNLILAILI